MANHIRNTNCHWAFEQTVLGKLLGEIDFNCGFQTTLSFRTIQARGLNHRQGMFFREMGFPESWKGVGRAIVQGDPALISLFQEPGEPKSDKPSLRQKYGLCV